MKTGLMDTIAGWLGYAPTQKSVGQGLLSAFARNTGGAPRPTVHNMGKYLERYADQAWVFACINLIQAKGAEVPLRVYRVTAEGLQHQPGHPLQKLLEQANPIQSGYDLREATHGYVELTGNSYWLLDAFVAGKPTEIYALNPAYIKIKTDTKEFVTGYVYEVNGQVIETFKASEILHFKTWNPLDEFYGMARIAAARDASDSMLFADVYNKTFFENSAESGGALTTDQPIEQDAGTRILQAWESNHKGPRKAHKIALLHSGLKFQPTTITHKDMEFSALKDKTREDILAVFRIPPVMLGIMDEGNVSKKEQRKVFWQDSMIPRLRKIENVINEFLVKPWGTDLVVMHDLSQIEDLQEDKKARAEEDEILTRAGIKVINEVRKERGLPGVPWGDTWNAPIGLMSIETERAPAPAPAAPEDEPEDELDQEDDEGKAAAPTPAIPEVQDKSVIRRDGLWQVFKGFTEAHERRWGVAMRRLFNAQEREVMANLREGWEQRSQQARLDGLKTLKQSIDVIIFDRGEARKVFRRDARKLMEFTLTESAKGEASRYDLPAFDLAEPRVQKWLDEKAFKFADDINDTTEERLRSELEEAVKAGEAISKVEKRIEDVFDIARGARTQAIARTEVVSASNAGAFMAYEQSGVVQETEWITARDGKVRDSHQIDGETAGLGQTFKNGLKYPGEPGAPADEVVNCRCTVAPVIKRS
jgi:HK97 family phage portal protein